MSDEVKQPDELTVLKKRAAKMGIKHSSDATVESLKAKIQDKLEGTKKEEAPKASKLSEAQSKALERTQRVKEANRLIRVRITCHNPAKRALKGEFFTVANGIVGTVRKFVPYQGDAAESWHVPKIIFDHLKERKYVESKFHKINGIEQLIQTTRNEFAIEELEPLSAQELKQLALKQQAAAGIAE